MVGFDAEGDGRRVLRLGIVMQLPGQVAEGGDVHGQDNAEHIRRGPAWRAGRGFWDRFFRGGKHAPNYPYPPGESIRIL